MEYVLEAQKFPVWDSSTGAGHNPAGVAAYGGAGLSLGARLAGARYQLRGDDISCEGNTNTPGPNKLLIFSEDSSSQRDKYTTPPRKGAPDPLK